MEPRRTAGDAGIVEQDHLAGPGEPVGYRRIPMIERALEMLVEDDRYASRLAEAAVGEADPVGLQILGRSRFVGVGHCRHQFLGDRPSAASSFAFVRNSSIISSKPPQAYARSMRAAICSSGSGTQPAVHAETISDDGEGVFHEVAVDCKKLPQRVLKRSTVAA